MTLSEFAMKLYTDIAYFEKDFYAISLAHGEFRLQTDFNHKIISKLPKEFRENPIFSITGYLQLSAKTEDGRVIEITFS